MELTKEEKITILNNLIPKIESFIENIDEQRKELNKIEEKLGDFQKKYL